MCITCMEQRLGVFFDTNEFFIVGEWNQPNLYMKCLGCKLTNYLNEETDHNKQIKQVIIKRWLRDDRVGESEWSVVDARMVQPPPSGYVEDDIGYVLRDKAIRRAVKAAEFYENQRREALEAADHNELGYDYNQQVIPERHIQYSPCLIKNKKDKESTQW